MKLVDANLLLYATDERSPRHEDARSWLEERLTGDEPVAFAWAVPLVRQLLRPIGTAGNLVADAHLAALAIEHGAELSSCDTDFARFSGLRWSDPLT